MDDLLRLQVRAIGDFITRRSIAVILRPKGGRPGIGSATCIKVGSHYLLATAAHVIANLDDAAIDLRTASELSGARIPFAGRSINPGDPLPATDVAWLEIPGEAVRTHHLEFIEL